MASLPSRFQSLVAARFAAEPGPAAGAPAAPLAEVDLAQLPPPVRRYLLQSGAVGRPRPRNFRIGFDAEMFRKPGDRSMPSRSLQYNFLSDPARFFLMRSRMFGLPVAVLHAYQREQATMQVRVAGLFDVVNLSGDALSGGETVTLLNDLAFFAPGALCDARLAWGTSDARSAQVAFTNGRRRVTATLHFNDRDELVDFSSDDRPALGEDGKLKAYRWRTPVSGYRDFGGRRVATRGDAIYAWPDGDFTYGRFSLTSFDVDVDGPLSSTP